MTARPFDGAGALFVGDRKVAEHTFARVLFSTSYDGFSLGADLGNQVSTLYRGPNPFQGEIVRVRITVDTTPFYGDRDDAVHQRDRHPGLMPLAIGTGATSMVAIPARALSRRVGRALPGGAAGARRSRSRRSASTRRRSPTARSRRSSRRRDT